MKKIFTYSIAAVLLTLLFTSCTKDRVVYDNRSYWTSQERGDVVYSSNTCGLYVVETNYGYTIIENLDGIRTYEGDVMYGSFGYNGTRDFYNYTADAVTRGQVLEYDLTYNETLGAIDYYCPSGRVYGFKMQKADSTQHKLSRGIAPLKK